MSSVRLIVGKQGRGKSTLAHHFARLSGKREVIFDPRLQFHFSGAPGAHGQAEFESLLEAGRFPAVYQPPLRARVRDHFEDFVEVILETPSLAVVIDEGRYLMSAQAIDENLSVLLRAYRQLDHDVIVTAHRMVHVHGDVAEPADALVLFGTRHPRSLERIADFTTAEAAAEVEKLKGRDYLEYFDATEDFRVQRDAAAWQEKISPVPTKARAA